MALASQDWEKNPAIDEQPPQGGSLPAWTWGSADRTSQVFAFEQLPGQRHAVAAIPSVPARRDFGPCRVPEGQYFMMGDNRDNGFDSRYFGPAPRKQIVGRATAVALSFDRGTTC